MASTTESTGANLLNNKVVEKVSFFLIIAVTGCTFVTDTWDLGFICMVPSIHTGQHLEHT